MKNNMKHTVKDSVFTTLFGESKYTLDLYRSLHPEDTETTEKDIKIITTDNILVSGMFNDLSFLIGLKMMIFAEAQSTFSVKLAIRLFLYYAVSLKEYIDDMEIDLYSIHVFWDTEQKILSMARLLNQIRFSIFRHRNFTLSTLVMMMCRIRLTLLICTFLLQTAQRKLRSV